MDPMQKIGYAALAFVGLWLMLIFGGMAVSNGLGNQLPPDAIQPRQR